MPNQFIFVAESFGPNNGKQTTSDNPVNIRDLQKALNRSLGTNLPIDGVMSFRTRKAIRNFQRRKGLPSDGTITPKLKKALGLVRGQVISGIFGEQKAEEFETATCPPFTLTAMENPGGGRVKDKKIPRSSDIVVIQGAYGKTPLHRLTAAAHQALVCAARAAGLKHPLLLPTGAKSGFRDPKMQGEAWERALKKYGSEKEARKWVAKPGFSAHQSGRAIDFNLGLSNSSGNVARLRQTAAYKWMVANAHRFGFYPYPEEPWHWEYNPPATRQSEFFAEMDEALGYESNFGNEFEVKTAKKCERRDWCSPNYIQWVQKSLNQLGKSGKKLREDGFHDDSTRFAIIAFQKQAGLKPDGEVGPLTEKALVSKGAGTPPGVKNLSCTPTKPEILIAKLNKHRGSIPLHILLGWIEVESGGQIGSITSLCERGYFQIYPGEAKDRGIPNHQMLSYDEDQSILGGIKLLNYFISRTNTLVKKYGLPANGEVYWKFVKLHHWIPSGPEKILSDMQAHGVKPANWAAVTAYSLNPANRERLKQKIKRDPQQGFKNADAMIDKANVWLKKIGAGSPISKESDFRFAQKNFESDDREYEFELPKAAAAPPLWKTEKSSIGETLYINTGIGLGKNIERTGIFIPASFNPNTDFELVIYLHGHKGMYPGNSALIDLYWNTARFPFFGLREEVAASGKNVIFAAPSLGPRSEAGSLVRKGGFDAYVSQVSAALNEHYVLPRSKKPLREIQNIILAAHSGGGWPMLQIVRGGDRYAARVQECWCFDSMYGTMSPYWTAWAKSNPNKNLYVYYGPAKGGVDPKTGKRSTLPRDNAEAIACEVIKTGLKNICVEPSRATTKGRAGAHFWVPVVYLKERLLHSACPRTDVCPKRPTVKKRTV